MKPATPDLDLLDDVVAERVLATMRTTSAMLTAAGIRHALCRGLAVGAHRVRASAATAEYRWKGKKAKG